MANTVDMAYIVKMVYTVDMVYTALLTRFTLLARFSLAEEAEGDKGISSSCSSKRKKDFGNLLFGFGIFCPEV